MFEFCQFVNLVYVSSRNSRSVNPTLDKQYADKGAKAEHDNEGNDVIKLNDVKCWPKGSYTQQWYHPYWPRN